MQTPTRLQIELEASTHLDMAAFHLYYAGQIRHDYGLPGFDSKDAEDMRKESKYLAMGAHRRGDPNVRLMAIERVANELATLNGDSWPDCLTRIPAYHPDKIRLAKAALLRQKYRAHAIMIHGAVTSYYEMGLIEPSQLKAAVEVVKASKEADRITVEEHWKSLS